MLKTIDVPISKPEDCPVRKFMEDPEISPDYQQSCYCELPIPGVTYESYRCVDPGNFPDNCPLGKFNFNIWRDR